MKVFIVESHMEYEGFVILEIFSNCADAVAYVEDYVAGGDYEIAGRNLWKAPYGYSIVIREWDVK